jgi:hypothetical protein
LPTEFTNNQQQHLYYLYVQEKAGNKNYHKEKKSIIKFIEDQLEKHVDIQVKGLDYIIRVFNSLPKGNIETASGILNTLLNKLNNVMPETHLPGYNYCGPFTRLDERLARGDVPVNKLDAGCQKHDIFYQVHKDTKERHIAHKELADIANERMHASDTSIGQKISSALVRTIMNSKVAFGMGLHY